MLCLMPYSLLNRYPQIDWKSAKGMRDIISHHYFDLDAEAVFNVCKTNVPEMLLVIHKMSADSRKIDP